MLLNVYQRGLMAALLRENKTADINDLVTSNYKRSDKTSYNVVLHSKKIEHTKSKLEEVRG